MQISGMYIIWKQLYRISVTQNALVLKLAAIATTSYSIFPNNLHVCMWIVFNYVSVTLSYIQLITSTKSTCYLFIHIDNKATLMKYSR